MADQPGQNVARQSRLREILDKPGGRQRLSRPVASLLATVVASIGILGALVIWHLVRRGRLIQHRLGPPRDVRMPELGPNPRSAANETTTEPT